MKNRPFHKRESRLKLYEVNKNVRKTILEWRKLMLWVITVLYPDLYIQYNLKCFLHILIMSMIKVKKLRNLQLALKSIPSECLHRVRKAVTNKVVDLNRVIFIPEQVAGSYGFGNLQWISVHWGKIEQFPCQVLVIPQEVLDSVQLDSKMAFMTPTALFNIIATLGLNRRNPQKVQVTPIVLNQDTKSKIKFGVPVVPAKVVRLARVASSEAVSNIENVLKGHFEQARLLTIGDLIGITGHHDQETWFKVAGIESDLKEERKEVVFRASTATSSVFLMEKDVQSYRPICSTQFIPCDSLGRLFPTSSPCLESCITSISDWIDSFSKFTDRRSSPGSDDELWPTILLTGPVGCGKFSVYSQVSRRQGMNLHIVNVAGLIGDSSAFTIAQLLSKVSQRVKTLSPCIVLLKNIHFLGKDQEGNDDKRVVLAFIDLLNEIKQNRRKDLDAVFIIGTTHCPDEISPQIKDCFIHKVSIEPLKSEEELRDYLEWKGSLQPNLQFGFDLVAWLTKTGAKNILRHLGDLKALMSTAINHAQVRELGCSNSKVSSSSSVTRAMLIIEETDFDFAFAALEQDVRTSVGSPKVPVVNWSDIGGLPDVKKELISSVQLPLRFPHLFTSGLKRSGILLYGPPGTGKTLLAKAVASEFKINFLSVKGPELLNMYVGQSEQNVREVFQRARDSSPCVLFFDELDSLAPNRGKSGDSGGVMDRVVSQILAELDGTHSTPNVFIIGATNRPDLIDTALLRPGRFDKLIYVGVSADSTAAGSILKALTRKFKMGTDVDLDTVAAELPEGMSGADLSALSSEAFMEAITRTIAQIEKGECDADEPVTVIQQDFLHALSKVKPSLAPEELEKYQQLKSFMR